MSTEEKNPAQEAFKEIVKARYDVNGSTANMIFRTSRELAYDCREMCEPSLPDIGQVMTELGFKCDQFCGTYTWIMYDKIELRY